MTDTKPCPHCRKNKPFLEFNRNVTKGDGLAAYCAVCEADYGRSRRKRLKTVDAVGFKAREMAKGARRRAKKQGVDCDVDPEFVKGIIPECCPILGVTLDFSAEKTYSRSPSLDRCLPEIGYLKPNIRVLSHRANALKNDGSVTERHMLVAWMENMAAAMKSSLNIDLAA